MFEKLKKMFKKKESVVKITITINDEIYENVTPEQAEILFKKLSEGLKKTSV